MAKKQRGKPKTQIAASQASPDASLPLKSNPSKSNPIASTEAILSDSRSQIVNTDGSPTFSSDTHRVGVLANSQNSVMVRTEINAYMGPLPSIEYFRELKSIFPNGPKTIIESYQKQGDHRRYVEKVTIESKTRTTERGQILGFILVLAALLGSFYLISRGFQGSGLTIIFTSLISVVGLFVHGRESQKKERTDKEVIRQKIARNEPIESVVGPSIDDSADQKP